MEPDAHSGQKMILPSAPTTGPRRSASWVLCRRCDPGRGSTSRLSLPAGMTRKRALSATEYGHTSSQFRPTLCTNVYGVCALCTPFSLPKNRPSIERCLMWLSAQKVDSKRESRALSVPLSGLKRSADTGAPRRGASSSQVAPCGPALGRQAADKLLDVKQVGLAPWDVEIRPQTVGWLA